MSDSALPQGAAARESLRGSLIELAVVVLLGRGVAAVAQEPDVQATLQRLERLERDNAERLEKLERFGIISKRVYQRQPSRHEYRLTRAGADLLPILQAFAVWSERHIPGRWKNPPWFDRGVPSDFYPPISG